MDTVQAVVIQRAHITYAECGGKTLPVGVGNDTAVLGEYWGVPVMNNGLFQGYNFVAKVGDAPTGAIPIVRTRDKVTGDILHILGTAADLTAAAADEAVDPMPLASTIPVPVPQIAVCDDGSGEFTRQWTPPVKAAGDEYQAHVSVDGEQAVPALAGGHTDLAAMVTWLNTNYSAAGTWSAVGSQLQLVSTTANSVGVVFTVGNYT